MKLTHQHKRRASLAVVALALVGVAPAVFAAGADTNFNTDITNTASVNYSVSGVPQTVIQSSPSGNSTPGAGGGTATTFKVDKKVMFVAEETNTAATVTSPGLTGVVTVFKVTNTTNGAQEFKLDASNTQPTPVQQIFGRNDAFDMSNFTVHVSSTACAVATTITPTFAGEPATTFLPAIAEDSCAYVFVRADTPAASASVANGNASTIQLRVRPSNTGGTVIEAPSGAADAAGTVDIVYAESGVAIDNVINNGESLAYDQYFVGTLTVTKAYSVVSDGFSPAGQAKAIPGAVIQYTITVQNNGLVTSGATLTEIVPANTTYVAGSTTLNGVAVADVAGTMPFVTARAINSPAAASGVINPGSTAAERAVVVFRVTINN
ncbi:MAG TPA: hypothetical protein VM146_18500 [Steroidobacteraceae bacterium]|nr:hypothetical protein [Steroidobacteraceae bacterium]